MRLTLLLFIFIITSACQTELKDDQAYLEYDFPHRIIKNEEGLSFKLLENLKPTKVLSDYAIFQFSDIIKDEYIINIRWI